MIFFTDQSIQFFILICCSTLASNFDGRDEPRPRIQLSFNKCLYRSVKWSPNFNKNPISPRCNRFTYLLNLRFEDSYYLNSSLGICLSDNFNPRRETTSSPWISSLNRDCLETNFNLSKYTELNWKLKYLLYSDPWTVKIHHNNCIFSIFSIFKIEKTYKSEILNKKSNLRTPSIVIKKYQISYYTHITEKD